MKVLIKPSHSVPSVLHGLTATVEETKPHPVTGAPLWVLRTDRFWRPSPQSVNQLNRVALHPEQLVTLPSRPTFKPISFKTINN